MGTMPRIKLHGRKPQPLFSRLRHYPAKRSSYHSEDQAVDRRIEALAKIKKAEEKNNESKFQRKRRKDQRNEARPCESDYYDTESDTSDDDYPSEQSEEDQTDYAEVEENARPIEEEHDSEQQADHEACQADHAVETATNTIEISSDEEKEVHVVSSDEEMEDNTGSSIPNAQHKPRRIALCIGINEYPGNRALPNCEADAEDMHAMFKRLGFDDVILLKNANKFNIMKTIRELCEEFVKVLDKVLDKDGSVVVIFFSGHGSEYEGEVYLWPAAMESTKEKDLAETAISANAIMKATMKALGEFESVVVALLLDCCRYDQDNDTFKCVNGRADGTANGFVKNFRSTRNKTEFLVGLACDPGTFAQAGDGDRNSPYTAGLLKQLEVAGRTLEESMREVTKHVYKNTGKKQLPWCHSCVMQRVVLLQ